MAKELLEDRIRSVNNCLEADYIPSRYVGKDNSHKEVFFISYPKAGRTWITFLIARILQRKYGFPESDVVDLEKISRDIKDLPNITIIHEDEPHKKEVSSLSKNKREYCNKNVILIVRDPRDIIVSFYFHQSRRKGENNYKKTISDFLFEKVGGFDVILEYYNIWARNRHIPARFMIVRYEDFMKNTKKETSGILNLMGVKGISDEEISEAIEFASFKNMREMEIEGKFDVKRLRATDLSDPESFKVRKGVIGGYKDYLKEGDINKLNLKMSLLSEVYSYTS